MKPVPENIPFRAEYIAGVLPFLATVVEDHDLLGPVGGKGGFGF